MDSLGSQNTMFSLLCSPQLPQTLREASLNLPNPVSSWRGQGGGWTQPCWATPNPCLARVQLCPKPFSLYFLCCLGAADEVGDHGSHLVAHHLGCPLPPCLPSSPP